MKNPEDCIDWYETYWRIISIRFVYTLIFFHEHDHDDLHIFNFLSIMNETIKYKYLDIDLKKKWKIISFIMIQSSRYHNVNIHDFFY